MKFHTWTRNTLAVLTVAFAAVNNAATCRAGMPFEDQPHFLGDVFSLGNDSIPIQLRQTDIEVDMRQVDDELIQMVKVEYRIDLAEEQKSAPVRLNVIGENVSIQLGYSDVGFQRRYVKNTELPATIQEELKHLSTYYEANMARIPLNTFEIELTKVPLNLIVQYIRPHHEFTFAYDSYEGEYLRQGTFNFWLNQSLAVSPVKVVFEYPADFEGPTQNLEQDKYTIARNTKEARPYSVKTSTFTASRATEKSIKKIASRRIPISSLLPTFSHTAPQEKQNPMPRVAISVALLLGVAYGWYWYHCGKVNFRR